MRRGPWSRGKPLRTASLLAAATLVLGLACALGGCGAPAYYAQAISGEIRLLGAARPTDEWLADPATEPAVRARLSLARDIRRFAAGELGLPDNRSYTRYADLHRSSAVWNVFATPELSLTLKTWCYPLFGCAGYRGYFAQADAQALEQELRSQGLDATVAPVPAFSTLGWFADPLLSTFIQWPEPELARLIFHELAHQIVYVADDTRFNESFATCVERAGLERWVARRADPVLQEQYARYRQRHADLLALLAQTRSELLALYAHALEGEAGKAQAPQSAEALAATRRAKQDLFAQLQERYAQTRDARWEGYRGFDAYFAAPWNNARVAAMAAYNDDVPAFEALLAREHGDLPHFYAAVRRLAGMDAAARRAALQDLEPRG